MEHTPQKYLAWQEKTITDFSEENVSALYDAGFVFTRIGKGVMQQTRSVRIDLAKFNLSSENRRILKKTGSAELYASTLPVKRYFHQLGKLAKDFYEAKFGPRIMSAQKIKEMVVDPHKSNFNLNLMYPFNRVPCGYSICYANKDILHYSYPFYDLTTAPKDMGLGMMIRAIEYAKGVGMKYIYLGSLQRPSDTYKLQFEGLEWFDGKEWSTDEKKVREILAKGE
jgi:arginyl-tRNA--protein-N-Asp/Glu arginylyltransferase